MSHIDNQQHISALCLQYSHVAAQLLTLRLRGKSQREARTIALGNTYSKGNEEFRRVLDFVYLQDITKLDNPDINKNRYQKVRQYAMNLVTEAFDKVRAERDDQEKTINNINKMLKELELNVEFIPTPTTS